MRNSQLQMFRRLPPLVPVPKLTAQQHGLLGELVMLEGRPWVGEVDSTGRRNRSDIALLRKLIRLGCIQVMAVSPARYRVTKLGLVARSLGVRA